MNHPVDRAQRRALKNKKSTKKVKVDAWKKLRKEELQTQEAEDDLRAAKEDISRSTPGLDYTDTAGLRTD